MTTTTTTLPPHVLAIDDDAAMRQLIADYLGENELRVTTVATGADMEKVLAEHAVDVVVLDLRLAGEDGMQLAKKLRETSEIPDLAVNRLTAPVLQQVVVQMDAVEGGAGGMGFVEIREVLVNEMWQWFG